MTDLSKLSGPALLRRIAEHDTKHSTMLDDMIATGLGNYRHSDMVECAKGSGLLSKVQLCRDYLKLWDTLSEARAELDIRKRYHGGAQPIRRKTYA